MRVIWDSLCDKLQKSGGRGTRWGGKELAKRRVTEINRGVETPGGKGNAEGAERSQRRDAEEVGREPDCVPSGRARAGLRSSAPLSPGPSPRQQSCVPWLGLRPRPHPHDTPPQPRWPPQGGRSRVDAEFCLPSARDLHQPRLSHGGGSPRQGGSPGWVGWARFTGGGVCRRGGDRGHSGHP